MKETARIFSVIGLCTLLVSLTMPVKAATATLSVNEFSASGGYVHMACLVTLTGYSSAWETVDFHVGYVGYWTSSATDLWVGQGGTGDHRYPADEDVWGTMLWQPDGTGTYDVWAVAHGYTVNPPNHTSWDVSIGDHYYTYL